MLKKCNRKECKNPWKHLSEFNKDKSSPDGYSRRCRECSRKLQRNHYQRNKESHRKRLRKRRKDIREFLENYKKGKSCKICGYNEHHAALAFHHRNPKEKKFPLGEAAWHGVSMKKLLKEIEKCDILCANCHNILHWKERYGDVV